MDDDDFEEDFTGLAEATMSGTVGEWRRDQEEERKNRLSSSRTHWRTGGGKEIRPRDMTDDHLRNTIMMIERKNIHVRCWGALLYEAGRRQMKLDIPEVR